MDPSKERTRKRKCDNAKRSSRSTHVAKKKCEDTKQYTYLDMLPDVPMGVIMKFLPISARMNLCKAVPRAEAMAKNPKLWNHVHADMWAIGGKDLISMMWAHRKYVTSLTMECTENRVMRRTQSVRTADPVDVHLVERLKSFKQLQNVRIEGAVLSSSLLLKLPPTLKTLTLMKCSMPEQPIKPFIVGNFSDSHSQEKMLLENFHIHDCQRLRFKHKSKSRSIVAMGPFFPCLRSLHYTDTTRRMDLQTLKFLLYFPLVSDTLEEIDISRADITDAASDHKAARNWYTVNKVLEMLVLKATDCHFKLRVIRGGHRNDIDDIVVKTLMDHSSPIRQSLEELHLNGCPQLNDAALVYFRQAQSLTLLNLTGCTGISAGAVSDLKLSCPKLNVLYDM